jgi:hypothetical protein
MAHILDLLATISGILAFVWIGLRSDLKGFADAGARIKADPRNWGGYGRLFGVAGPYILFICAAITLISREHRIVVAKYAIKTIQADRGPLIRFGTTDVSSRDEHFHITISGSIAGEEADAIVRKYGTRVRVFATVSGPDAITEGLVWVQGNESGTLDSHGNFQVGAYLGGIGVDSARDGQIFPVRIYIPEEQGIDFQRNSQYDDLKDLPKPVFISSPVFIRCVRPPNRAAASP